MSAVPAHISFSFGVLLISFPNLGKELVFVVLMVMFCALCPISIRCLILYGMRLQQRLEKNFGSNVSPIKPLSSESSLSPHLEPTAIFSTALATKSDTS